MRDLDQIVGRIEEQRVQAELRADARGDDGRIEPAAAPFLRLRGDLQRRAARRVLLLRVVALLDARGVLREARDQIAGAAGQSEDDVRAGREVRSVHAADAGALHAPAHVVQAIVPAGRADDQPDLVVAGQAQGMIERRGVGEVDHHLGAAQRLVAVDVEDADHVMAALVGHLLDGLPHLAVTVNGELHTSTGASNSAACTARTASSARFSSQTIDRFSPDVPSENIDIGTPRMASNTRAPTIESLIRLRPTMAMMHCSSSSETSMPFSSSRARSSGMLCLSSTVTETETSDVVIRSTETCSSPKMAKSFARKPCAP